MHHIAFTEITAFDDAVQTLGGAGFVVSVAGHFADDRWCYLEQGTLVIELTGGEGPAGRFAG